MLSNIEKYLQPLVYAEAEKFAEENDRRRFDSVFTVVENFSVDNRGIIGGLNGINMLAGIPKSKDSYQYDIYIENPDVNSKKLADLIYDFDHKYINKDTLRVETKMKYKIYEIWAEGRIVVKMYALSEYRGIKLFLLLNPVRAYGYFIEDRKIYAMSPEIQLIDIYRRLYNPYPASRLALAYDTYDVLLENERKLYKVISEDIMSRAKGIEEDIMSVTRPEGGARDKRGDSASYVVSKVSKALLKEFAKLDIVVVGDYALHQILPDYPFQERLQILTSESIDDLKKLVESTVRNDKQVPEEYKKVSYVRYPLNLPNDIYIEKHSLYLGGRDKQIFLCDVFDSLTYEVVPYIKADENDVKWGNLLVCARFKFIDLYVSRLINNIREGKDAFVVSKIAQVSRSISRVRTKIFDILERSPLEILQTDNFAGKFVQPQVLLMEKLESAPGGRRFYPKYYPTKKEPSEIVIRGVN